MPMTSGKPVRFLTRSTIKRQWLGLLIVSMLIIARLPTAAAEPARKWHPVAEIQAAAENYLKLSAGVSDERLIPTAGFLDPRLQLPLCSDLLDPFVRQGTRVTGRTIVGVRCSGVKPWKIYLPVYVAVMEDVLITRNAMPRGHIIQLSDLELAERDVSEMTGDYTHARHAAVGKRMKRSIGQGVVLKNSLMQADIVIKRGQSVVLTLQSNSFGIKMSGTALSGGAINDRIRVKNTGSGQIVEGLIRSADRVEVALQ